MVIELRLMPPESLVAHKCREIQKNAHTVDDIRKVKSLWALSKPLEHHREQLGKHTFLETGKEADVVVRGVVDYYFGLRILSTAWAKAGNHEASSMARKADKVPLGFVGESGVRRFVLAVRG